METVLKLSVLKFYCDTCKSIFDAVPEAREFNHPVYGACKTIVSNCPECGKEASEYIKPKQKSNKNNYDMPSCGGGSCGCCG